MKLTEATWMFLDTETTGLKPEEGARVIEFGSAFIDRMTVSETYDFLINPEGPIPGHITKITGIDDKMVAKKPPFKDVAAALLNQFQHAEFVAAYNKDFDRKMLESEFKKLGMKMPDLVWLDPLTWSRTFITADDQFGQKGDVENHKLTSVAQQFKIDLTRAHRADADAEAGANVLIKFFQWGMEEANFPDDVEALKQQERGWRKDYSAKSRVLKPLKDPKTGKLNLTGTPGQVAQNVYDHMMRDRFQKLHEMGKWRK